MQFVKECYLFLLCILFISLSEIISLAVHRRPTRLLIIITTWSWILCNLRFQDMLTKQKMCCWSPKGVVSSKNKCTWWVSKNTGSFWSPKITNFYDVCVYVYTCNTFSELFCDSNHNWQTKCVFLLSLVFPTSQFLMSRGVRFGPKELYTISWFKSYKYSW